MRLALACGLAAIAAAPAAWAATPVDGGLGLQPAATPVMEEIRIFHNVWLMPIITAISVLVLGLLVCVMVFFNKRANPTPAHFHHNTTIEVVWTVVPVMILCAIAFPSFKLLYFQDLMPDGETVVQGEVVPAPELTIKTIGYQWYWGYEYPDLGISEYISTMLPEEADETLGLPAAPEGLYLLAVDEPVVAPADVTVRVLVTAADVIHNWAMPAFGIKMDAIPGRTNETWFHVDEPGAYYGQCSELCGVRHAFMPIQVEIVERPVFDAWAAAKADGDDDGARRILDDYRRERDAAIEVAALEAR